MKIQAGYKQTEVGVIPVDWEVIKLGEIADSKIKWSITGGPFGSNLKSSDYTADGIRIIQLQNIGDGIFLDDYKIYTSENKANELLSCNIYPGEIIISKMGDPVARACLIPNIDKRYLMCSDGIRLVVDNKLYDKKFIHDYINSKYFRNQAIDASTGSTRMRIGLQDLKQLTLLVPLLPEQKEIAQSLSDVDTLITALDQVITKKRNTKQSTMQQLLTGKKRLPGFSGEWEVKKLGEIADSKIKWSITGGPFGSNLKSSDYTADGIRIIQLQNIGDGIFLDDYKIYTSENKANELLSCNIYPGEIIISKMGDPVARACLIPNIDKRYLMCSDGIRLVVDNKLYDKKFIHDYINSKYFRNQAIDASTGSTRMRIGLQDLKQLTLLVPLLPEQKAIAQVLSDMDAEIEVLEKKRDKYKIIKQGMMQELLTGKTRLINS